MRAWAATIQRVLAKNRTIEIVVELECKECDWRWNSEFIRAWVGLWNLNWLNRGEAAFAIDLFR